MSQRTALLEHERKKLALLRAKVVDQERRVQMLEAIEDDPLDALLERELAAAAAVQTPAPSAPSEPPPPVSRPSQDTAKVGALDVPPAPFSPELAWGQSPRYPRKVPPTWVQLLRYLGREGKSYDDVKMYIRDRGLALSEGAARTQLMNYRKEFGFVESPNKGFYRATERALAFIDKQEGGSPVRQDGGSETQTHALAGSEA